MCSWLGVEFWIMNKHMGFDSYNRKDNDNGGCTQSRSSSNCDVGQIWCKDQTCRSKHQVRGIRIWVWFQPVLSIAVISWRSRKVASYRPPHGSRFDILYNNLVPDNEIFSNLLNREEDSAKDLTRISRLMLNFYCQLYRISKSSKILVHMYIFHISQICLVVYTYLPLY